MEEMRQENVGWREEITKEMTEREENRQGKIKLGRPYHDTLKTNFDKIVSNWSKKLPLQNLCSDIPLL
jgi:hypothetical protein